MNVRIGCQAASILAAALSITALASAQTPAQTPAAPVTLLVEAEDFQLYANWLRGSDPGALGGSMLRTRGGDGDAVTVVDVPADGTYRLWTRAFDFAEDRPRSRRYLLVVDDQPVDRESGQHGQPGWKWEHVGTRDLTKGQHVVGLRDTAKFFGRCDAIVLTTADVDPNTFTQAQLKKVRIKPVEVSVRRTGQFVSPPILKDAPRRELARLQNQFVRITFIEAHDDTGQPVVIRQAQLRVGDHWLDVPVDFSKETLFLLHTLAANVNTSNLFPSWPGGMEKVSFEVAGKTYEKSGSNMNPFLAAPAQALIPRRIKQAQPASVTIEYQTPTGQAALGRWELAPDRREVRFSLTFTAPQSGEYSIGYSAFAPWQRGQIDYDLLSPLYQFQRLPDHPDMVTSSLTPHPMVLVQRNLSEAGNQPVCYALVADPEKLPFRWATATNAVYGFSLLNAQADVQPSIFSPVLGFEGSRLKAREERTVSWSLLLYPGNWKETLEYTSGTIFGVKDYRRAWQVSLTDAALNLVDLIKDDQASGWDADLKGFYNIESRVTVTQASPLTMLSAAVLTGDEDLYAKRALPSIEYTLSRPTAHYATIVPHSFPMYVNQEATQVRVPNKFFGASYWQGLHDLLGRQNPWLPKLALGDDSLVHSATYSSIPKWSEMLAAYRMQPRPELLDQIKTEADRFLAKDVFGKQTQPLAIQKFYNIHFYPYWWDLLDLYELTRDDRYLRAAEECAFLTIAGQWSHPTPPSSDVTIHPDNKLEAETRMWWRNDKEFRLGWPPVPGAITEKKVPAWLVSQIGLGFEQPTTYYGVGEGGLRNIMMSCWAANLLRLYGYTHRDIYQTYARNTIIGRFGNYPGYYLRGHTDLVQDPQYPLRGPDVTSFYYHHIPPHLAFTLDFLVTQATVRSAGKIDFPWVKQQGYVWFANRLYGHAPGRVFGDAKVDLKLDRRLVQVASKDVNYLVGRSGERFWLILMNELDEPVTPQLRVDLAGIGVRAGDFYEVFGADGESRGRREVKAQVSEPIPAKGLIALALPTTSYQPAAALPPVAQGYVAQELPGDWKRVHAFRIRSPFGKDSLYVVLEGRPAGGIAQLEMAGSPTLTDAVYPHEFTVHPWLADRAMEFTVLLKDSKTQETRTQTIALPGVVPPSPTSGGSGGGRGPG